MLLKRVINFVPPIIQSSQIKIVPFGRSRLCITPNYALYSSQNLPPPDKNLHGEESDKWESRLSEEARIRLFEIRVEVKQSFINISSIKLLKIIDTIDQWNCSSSFNKLTEMFQSGERVCDPATVKPSEWRHILSLTTRTARVKTYNYLGRRICWKVNAIVSFKRY